jgi:hypothetical protein
MTASPPEAFVPGWGFVFLSELIDLALNSMVFLDITLKSEDYNE